MVYKRRRLRLGAGGAVTGVGLLNLGIAFWEFHSNRQSTLWQAEVAGPEAQRRMGLNLSITQITYLITSGETTSATTSSTGDFTRSLDLVLCCGCRGTVNWSYFVKKI